MKVTIVSSILLASSVSAQQTAWGQCMSSAPQTSKRIELIEKGGGQGWTGATTCVSGYVCTYSNPYYSQCLPGSAVVSTTMATSTSKSGSTTTASGSSTSASATGSVKYGNSKVVFNC